MGWTLEQWAEAVAWFARVRGYTPLPTWEGSRLVRWRWWQQHGVEPSSQRLVLVPPEPFTYSLREVLLSDERLPLLPQATGIETNMSWACRLFRRMASESIFQPRKGEQR